MLVLMLWVLLKGSIFISFFLPRSVSTRKSCTESYSAEITTALRCKGRWCLYKASQQLVQSIRPYLRRASGWEALIGDGRGWRLIGRGSNPTAVLLKGRGLIQEDTFELFTLEAVVLFPPSFVVCKSSPIEQGALVNHVCDVFLAGDWQSEEYWTCAYL